MSKALVAGIGVCEQFQNDRPVFGLVRLIQKHAVHLELKLTAIKLRIFIQKLASNFALNGFQFPPALFQPGVVLQAFKLLKSCHNHMIIESFFNLDEIHP